MPAMDYFSDIRLWLLVVAVSRLGAAVTLAYYKLGSKGTEADILRFPQVGPERWASGGQVPAYGNFPARGELEQEANTQYRAGQI
jgi:hypothetical protein